jgi:hypothetical protein
LSQHCKQEVNWEFLLGSSKQTLQAFEQSRLNFAANMRKEIVQLLDAWVNENTNALLARWLIERNLAADASAICTIQECGKNNLKEQRTQSSCAAKDARSSSSTTAPQASSAALNASDKIFGDKSFTPPRIHAAS